MHLEPGAQAGMARLKALLDGEGAVGARDTADSVSALSALLVLVASEALAAVAARRGMRWDDCHALSAEVMRETASLLANAGVHPAQVKDGLCEPGSAAAHGLNALEHARLRASLIDACDQACDRIRAARGADAGIKAR